MRRIFLEDVGILPPHQRDAGRSKAKYKHEYYYVNTTHVNIYIVTRTGLVTAIESTPDVGGGFEIGYLYLCERVVCGEGDMRSYIRQVNRTHASEHRGVQRILAKEQFLTENGPIRCSSVDFAAKISRRELEDNGGSIFAEEQDVVVVLGTDTTTRADESVAMRAVHPYSVHGNLNAIAVTEFNRNAGILSFWFSITIIDNSDTFGAKWVVLADKPVLVKAKVDRKRADGVYVSYPTPAVITDAEATAEYFKFSDIDKIPHFKFYGTSREAAMSILEATNADALAKATESENKYKKAIQEKENAEREQEYRNRKHQQDMERLERDNERLQKEHQNSIDKADIESKAIVRKNTGDLFKYVPMLITAVVCMLNVMTKK